MKGPKHELNTDVLIKRWRVTGKIVARSFSPLRYDIQCPKRLHRGVPEDWLEPARGLTLDAAAERVDINADADGP